MASPVGHGLVGLLAHALTARDRRELGSVERASILVAAGVAADLDLALRWLDGRNHHQGETHSLGFALIIAACAWGLLRWLGRPGAGRGAAWVGACWLSHALVDFVSADTKPPLGPMLLWPASRAHFISPVTVFFDTRRSLSWDALRHDCLALALELAVLLPVVAAALLWRWRRARGAGARPSSLA
jgi:membrane-bound metal-dependent hydrolase YbcI (DUF457 family)